MADLGLDPVNAAHGPIGNVALSHARALPGLISRTLARKATTSGHAGRL